jgi:hypothetical protein
MQLSGNYPPVRKTSALNLKEFCNDERIKITSKKCDAGLKTPEYAQVVVSN